MVGLKGFWDTLESRISSRFLMGFSPGIRKTEGSHASYILLWEHGDAPILCEMLNRYYKIAKVPDRMCCMRVIAGTKYEVNVCCCVYVFDVVSVLRGLLKLLGLESEQR